MNQVQDEDVRRLVIVYSECIQSAFIIFKGLVLICFFFFEWNWKN